MSRRARRGGAQALAALALCLCALPGVAQAGTARVTLEEVDAEGGIDASVLSYVAAPGEVNRVTLISLGGAPSMGTVIIGPDGCQGDCTPIFVALRDAGARIRPGPGCEAIDPNTVQCAISRGNNGIKVLGGDRADLLDARPLAGSPAPAPMLRGGAGNDLLVGLRESASELRGDAGADKLIGGDGEDFLVGGPGNDHVEGRAGEDQLFGSRGNDTLLGAVANDEVKGGKGNDRIVGGRGIDKLDGGPGRDRTNSRDAHRERVLCGTGFDRVRADRRDMLLGCERGGRRR